MTKKAKKNRTRSFGGNVRLVRHDPPVLDPHDLAALVEDSACDIPDELEFFFRVLVGIGCGAVSTGLHSSLHFMRDC